MPNSVYAPPTKLKSLRVGDATDNAIWLSVFVRAYDWVCVVFLLVYERVCFVYAVSHQRSHMTFLIFSQGDRSLSPVLGTRQAHHLSRTSLRTETVVWEYAQHRPTPKLSASGGSAEESRTPTPTASSHHGLLMYWTGNDWIFFGIPDRLKRIHILLNIGFSF